MSVKDMGPFYHGTKADMKPGDLLEPGFGSNYGNKLNCSSEGAGD